jgi:hypothetical protein
MLCFVHSALHSLPNIWKVLIFVGRLLQVWKLAKATQKNKEFILKQEYLRVKSLTFIAVIFLLFVSPIKSIVESIHFSTPWVSFIWTGYCNRHDSLRVGRSRDLILVGVRFSALVLITPDSPSPLYYGYRVCLPHVERPGCSVQPHLEPRLKKESSYTATPSVGLHDMF